MLAHAALENERLLSAWKSNEIAMMASWLVLSSTSGTDSCSTFRKLIILIGDCNVWKQKGSAQRIGRAQDLVMT